VLTFLKNIPRDLLSLIYPPSCLLCGVELTTPGSNPHNFCCEGCASKSVFRPVGGSVDSLPIFASTLYGTEVAELILRAKEDNLRSAREYLAEKMSELLVWLEISRPISLLPMPSARRAERRRGFDHCYLLATAIARAYELRVQGGLPARPFGAPAIEVVRAFELAREPEDQTRLNHDERAANLEGAYRVRGLGKSESGDQRARFTGNLATRSVVLIDDVATSGATMREASRALRGAGVKPDLALVAAISPRLQAPLLIGLGQDGIGSPGLDRLL
jgi:predicted amidophosphoribosyltransferase